MNTLIQTVMCRRIWDSRGRPTVEVEVQLADGARGRGMAPAGASRGSREAIDLRDGGEHLGGWGVASALDRIRQIIAPTLKGMDALDQGAIDAALIGTDGTPTKSHLGGNATIAASMAVLNAAAASVGVPLWRYLAGDQTVSIPLPEIQIFGGGAHAGRRVDIQDFMIMPVGATTFDEAMVMTSNVYRAAGRIMNEQAGLAGVADEGGWWPNFDTNEQALDTLARAIDQAGYRHGEVRISLDIAASEFGKDGRYKLALEDRDFTTDEWVATLVQWTRRYSILSVEDPVAEDDRDGMIAFTSAVGGEVQVIGDDYLVTNRALVEEATVVGACNAVLIKPNQAGTISETHDALITAKKAGWGTIVSARSGETEDTIIAHLAVGWNAGQLKVGSFTRSERMAKWNEVLRIVEELGPDARFAGFAGLPIHAEGVA